MKKKLLASILLFLCFLLWRCATVTTPMGGPKDEDPPVLRGSNPEPNQKNFKNRIVQLYFSEDIKLKDPKDEIIITPSPGKETTILAKGRMLTIEPKNGWKDSTTYSISFREAVQDITESNPVPDLRLAFSTGPIIDSLSISGNVRDALTEKIPENITVAIYSADTFDIFRHTPVYFTKTNKEGNFKLENLKKDTYHIYAFEDKNKNLKVESQNEQLAFIATPFLLEKNKNKVTLPLFRVDARRLKPNKPRSTGDEAFIKFNKSIVDYKITPFDKSLVIPNSFADDQTEIKLLLKNLEQDSTQIHLFATDSLLQKADTVLYLKKGKNTKIEERLGVEVSSPRLEGETGAFQFNITSTKLIKSINTDSITLQLDSLINIHFLQTDFKWDTIHKKIELKTIIDKKQIDPNKKISLLLGKNFLQSHDNDSLKASSKPVKLVTLDESGNLAVEVINNQKEDFVIQLLSSDGKVVQSVANQKKYVFKFLEPATYKLRVVIDKNKNGKWDIGNILLKQEPEITIYYMNRENKYDIPMRANWEQGITISI